MILQLHFMGLLSDGGVHSHNTHLYGLLEMAKKERESAKFMYTASWMDVIHLLHQVRNYVEQLEAEMKKIGVGEIASVSGRYYAMDRDNRWDRVELAYNALTSWRRR